MTDARDGLVRELRDRLGERGLLTGRPALTVYARDASHLDWGRPLAVALPATAEDVPFIVAACARAGVPVVARGAGTGLSGGAVPPPGALVLGSARLTRCDAIDPDAQAVRAQPGVLNTELSRLAAPHALHFAPDPSSQAASTLGGNIAENAGGPHCLRLGVTTHHVRALEWCDAEGRRWSTGEPLAVRRGIDLCSLLCGSEGTLGLVTGAWLGLMPVPEAAATLLAEFPVLEDATAAVPGLLRAGLLPAAVEIIDRAMVLTVEEAFGLGLPRDVEAVMIAELAGPSGPLAEQAATAARVLREGGARAVRRAADEDERLALWQCRKRAFGAVGRLSPNYVSMDVVVPLGALPGLVREIQTIREQAGVRIATAFHAGDGNLHPAVHYDERVPGDRERAHAAADAIIRAALRRGGSLTGEHGIGLEKVHALPWQLDGVTASLLGGIKTAFDPSVRLNPGKALPQAAAGPDAFAPSPPVPDEPRFRWDDLTVTAPAGTPLAALQTGALARGLWLPVGWPVGPEASGGELTVGQLIDRLLVGPAPFARATARDLLLEVWARTGDGRAFHAGAPVFKNVAGYDLPRLLCGAHGHLARLTAATFQLRPAPAEAWVWRLESRAATAGPARPHAQAPEPVTPVAVGALLRGLGAVGDGLAGGQVYLERDPAGAWVRAVLLASGPAGGSRAAGERLAGLVSELGLEATAATVRPFAASGAGASRLELPDWTWEAATWTVLQPLPGHAAGMLPPGPCRLVWQDAPRLVWVPTPVPVELAAGWHADTVLSDGRPTTLPDPQPGVPRELLARLKHCFDPEDALGGPRWLAFDGATESGSRAGRGGRDDD